MKTISEWKLMEDELTDNKLTEVYKDMKMTDTPSMWEDIERNLAQKKPKKAVPVWRMASLAAVLVAVVILVPVLFLLRQQTHHKGVEIADGAAAENAEMEHKADQNQEADIFWNQEADGNTGAKGNSEQEAGGPVLQLQVEILKVKVEERGIMLTVKVLQDESGTYQAGAITTVLCEPGEDGKMEYEEADFQGTLNMKIKKEEKILKLFEILP